jgi:acetyl-CoA synthetase
MLILHVLEVFPSRRAEDPPAMSAKVASMDDSTPASPGGEIVWRPSDELVRGSRIARFLAEHNLPDYDALHRTSTEDIAWFWDAALREMGIEWYEPYARVYDDSAGAAWTKWWIGGRFNIVHNCVDKHRSSPRASKPAIRWEGEPGSSRALTYAELDAEVCRAAHALRAIGIRQGDRIAVFLPMIPEAAVVTLACAKIGAIFTPVFSGYAAEAVAARIRDCEAKLLVTADGFRRRGHVVDMKHVADEAADASPTVERVLTVRHLGSAVSWRPDRDVWWHEALASQPAAMETVPLDPETPFMIIYTSGTTGRPKGTVHVHGGFPLKAAQDLAFHFDVHERDVLFWLTDMGWMMGPWEVFGITALGATMVLYEGAADFPDAARLWRIVDRHGVTVLGIAPTAIRALMRHGSEPPRSAELSSLRVLGSTGEPWNPEPYLWYLNEIGRGRCPIINYSGGTEISGGIVGGTVVHPCKPCGFSGPCLGIAADVLGPDGTPVRGAVGELVVRKPWPGMTRGFWRDPERYVQTYWSRWPDVWVHGDWAATDADGFWYILGRSDDTIKVAGKRIGPAEVESTLTGHPAVAEAAAIGVPDPVRGEAVACFVILRPGVEESRALSAELQDWVAARMGKPLRPEVVRFVGDFPKTRNAKIMRRVIRALYLGRDPGDLSSLENPRAAEEIRSARGERSV